MALIVGLALAGGGFSLASRHVAGLAAWLVVVGFLVFGAASSAALERPLYRAAGLIAGLSLLSALSSFWSGAVELSFAEADRILVYLGFFLAAFLIAQTDERRQRFAEGLAAAVVLVALMGLASRLLPHAIVVENSLGSGARLRYPLGYWNANAAMAAIAVVLMLWTSRRATAPLARWISVAAIPACLLALYFTYSRGGLIVLLASAVCLLALSRDRLWLLATLAIGALGALPAVLAVQARDSLANNLDNQAAVQQGTTVLLYLLGGIALALLLFALLRRVEDRAGALTGRALAISRNPAILKRAALLVAIVAIAAAAAVGGRAWDRFSDSDVQFPQDPRQHFSDLSGAGRQEFWRVAVDAFGEKPALGQGAGAYQFSWTEKRSVELPVHNAHSLYLEAFAELGVVGGVLVLALVGTLLWTGFCAWRAAFDPAQRERYAALLAAMLAFAVGAAFDWFWEIAALGGVFFLAGGALVAARCRQIVADPRREPEPEGRGFRVAVAGLALAWLAAVALVGPLLVDREIHASQSAVASDNLPSAVDHAETARSIEPWAASPYVQLGLIAQLQRDYPAAVEHFSKAIEREDRNWQWYYLRSEVRHEAGEGAAARRDLERARELNPEAACLRKGWTCG